MRRVTPEEMREIQLRMLNIFADFCEEHHLRYSLGGGTLLGAVRHKGFIPWDDDIDVMMPRPDYEFFLKNFDGGATNTRLSYYLHDEDHIYLFAQLYDLRTTTLGKSFQKGVYIDIFPIDFFSDMDKVNEMWSWLYNLEMYNFRVLRNRKENFIKKFYYRILWELHLIKHHRFQLWKYTHEQLYNIVYGIMTSSDISSSQYGGAVIGLYKKKELMTADTFLEYILLPFEGKEYMCIKAYDSYLSQHYGDYMQLPKIQNRVSPHHIQVYWLE